MSSVELISTEKCAATEARCQESKNDEVKVDNKSPLLEGAPIWLTREYLEKCLRNYFKDQKLQLGNVDAQPALGRGENYGGVLTRVKVEYETGCGLQKTGHYIVKTSFEDDEFVRKTMEPYDIFRREMSIYENVLPKLKALLLEIGDDEKIFAETVTVDYEHLALIFEDLSAQDFYMPDRLKGFDKLMAKLVLRKLAKMHATSAVLNARERGCLEGYDRGFFNRHTDIYTPYFIGCLEACTRWVKQRPDFAYYGEKLEQLKPMYMELGKRVFDPTPSHVNVLAHGDLWTTNVLFKNGKDSGAVEEAIIIDFQYAVWGSPAIDLHYMLNTSLLEHLHLHEQDELIQCYHHYFADTLRKLKYSAHIPSLHSFHLQLAEKAFYALVSSCMVQPVQRCEETEDADFSSLMQTDERATRFKNSLYKNPFCQRMVRHLLPIYERRGLLDVDQ